MNTLEILERLVKCKSLTPNDDGAIQLCSEYLESLGFKTKTLVFNEVKSLYAKFGEFDKNICFAGHIDVVPPLDGWSSDPFQLTIKGKKAFGRGTNDMKGPLAACFKAIYKSIHEGSIPNETSISIMLTSDEEKMGEYGTKSVVKYLKENNEKINLCVLCESCSPFKSAEYIKTGCRGSLNINLNSSGKQCHVANAPIIGNHMHNLIQALNELINYPLDTANENFDPSSLQLTSLESSQNCTRNIISPRARALLNVRFNDNWTFKRLEKYVISKTEGLYVEFERFGNPFIGCSNTTAQKLQKIVEHVTGTSPQVGTKGGNSDALFIKEIAEVVEIGSPLSEAHIIDEYIKLEDLEILEKVYLQIIKNAGQI